MEACLSPLRLPPDRRLIPGRHFNPGSILSERPEADILIIGSGERQRVVGRITYTDDASARNGRGCAGACL